MAWGTIVVTNDTEYWNVSSSECNVTRKLSQAAALQKKKQLQTARGRLLEHSKARVKGLSLIHFPAEADVLAWTLCLLQWNPCGRTDSVLASMLSKFFCSFWEGLKHHNPQGLRCLLCLLLTARCSRCFVWEYCCASFGGLRLCLQFCISIGQRRCEEDHRRSSLGPKGLLKHILLTIRMSRRAAGTMKEARTKTVHSPYFHNVITRSTEKI